MVSPELSRVRITSLVLLTTLFLTQASWPSGHNAGSCSAGCLPVPPAPFQLGNFLATLPQACTTAWGCCGPTALSLAEFHVIVGGRPSIQAIQIPLQILLISSRSTIPPNLVSPANLLMVHSGHSSVSLMKTLKLTSIRHFGEQYLLPVAKQIKLLSQ